jgi:hypothetical protein
MKKQRHFSHFSQSLFDFTTPRIFSHISEYIQILIGLSGCIEVGFCRCFGSTRQDRPPNETS